MRERTAGSDYADTPEVARVEIRVRGMDGGDTEEDRPPDDGDAEDARHGYAARLVLIAVRRDEQH